MTLAYIGLHGKSPESAYNVISTEPIIAGLDKVILLE